MSAVRRASTATFAPEASAAETGRAVATVLQLARGRGVPPLTDAGDWALIFGVALRERCAVLAWSRAASVIRAAAPAEITARWRAHALERHAYAERQLRVLHQTVRQVESSGIDCVVLKGAPLSQRLYGDFALRASVDIDLFVGLQDRAGLTAPLGRLGWRTAEGEAPWTETFMLDHGSDRFCLEVHSSIVDLNLRHLSPRAPRSTRQSVGGGVLPVHDDLVEPAYLAAHAAKHMPVALLYFVDFDELWSAYDGPRRAAALAAAEAAGLRKYLDWMVARSALVGRAAEGDASALSALGVGAGSRTDTHALFRDLVLAPSPLAAIRSAAAWAWPPHLRRGFAPLLARWGSRFRGSLGRHVAKHGSYGGVTSKARSDDRQ